MHETKISTSACVRSGLYVIQLTRRGLGLSQAACNGILEIGRKVSAGGCF